MFKHTLKPIGIVAALFVTTGLPALSQNTNPVHTGSVEIGLFGSGSFGGVGSANYTSPLFGAPISISGSSGPGGGVDLGIAMNRQLFFEGEASFLDGGGIKAQNIGGGYTAQTSTRVNVYEGDLNVRLPRGQKFVPYLLAGASTVQTRADDLVSLSAQGYVPVGSVYNGATEFKFNAASFAPVTGAGFRAYLNPHLGIRFDLRGYFPTSGTKTPFARVSAGIFFQFR